MAFSDGKLIRLNPEQLFFSVRPSFEFPSGSWMFVQDRSVHLGPLAGLEAALRLSCHEFLVTLAVDMPAMTPAFLSSLLEKAGPAGVVPYLEGFYHGACAVYPARILPLLQLVLAGDDRSFQFLIRRALEAGLMAVQEIGPAESALFEDWNVTDDLTRARIRPE